MKISSFVVVLVAMVVVLVACGETDPLVGDGDENVSDGDSDDALDGDDDDLIDGDLADGDASDGDIADGDTLDGDKPDGDEPDGDAIDGDEDDAPVIDHNYSESEAAPNAYDELDYLIVTASDMVAEWQVLADWKMQKGVPTKVVSMDTVRSEATGRDDAEILRNYLRAQHEAYTLDFVLLAGDTPLVPHREFYAETDVLGVDYYDGVIASDLYFADLDGSWDANENDVFGEFEDDLDLYPEYSLTRLPVDDAVEAAGVVAKLIAYEQSPPVNFINDVLFLSEPTGFYGIDSSLGLDSMSREVFPDRSNIEKLYCDPTPYADAQLNTDDAQFSAIEAGPHFVVHFGHGGGTDVGFLNRDDLEALDNAPRSGIYVSTACHSGGFHTEIRAGGDSYVVNPDGGGVAYFGNTEVGIGFPSGMDFIYEFYKTVFQPRRKEMNLGKLNDAARINFTSEKQMYLDKHPDRWAVLSMVVFADPEMPVWRDEPKVLAVEHPQAVHADKYRFQTTVTSETGKPVEGARVALLAGPGRMYRAYSDAEGKVEICLEPGDVDALALTVTALDSLPYIAQIPVE